MLQETNRAKLEASTPPRLFLAPPSVWELRQRQRRWWADGVRTASIQRYRAGWLTWECFSSKPVVCLHCLHCRRRRRRGSLAASQQTAIICGLHTVRRCMLNDFLQKGLLPSEQTRELVKTELLPYWTAFNAAKQIVWWPRGVYALFTQQLNTSPFTPRGLLSSGATGSLMSTCTFGNICGLVSCFDMYSAGAFVFSQMNTVGD